MMKTHIDTELNEYVADFLNGVHEAKTDTNNQLGVPIDERAITSAIEAEIRRHLGLDVTLVSRLTRDSSESNAFAAADVTKQMNPKIFSQVALTFTPAFATKRPDIWTVEVDIVISMRTGRPTRSPKLEISFTADGKITKTIAL